MQSFLTVVAGLLQIWVRAVSMYLLTSFYTVYLQAFVIVFALTLSVDLHMLCAICMCCCLQWRASYYHFSFKRLKKAAHQIMCVSILGCASKRRLYSGEKKLELTLHFVCFFACCHFKSFLSQSCNPVQRPYWFSFLCFMCASLSHSFVSQSFFFVPEGCEHVQVKWVYELRISLRILFLWFHAFCILVLVLLP